MKPLSVWFYAIGLSLWLSLCFGAAAIVVNMNIREAENNLIRYGDAYSDHLNKGMVGREAILKGFSALFGAIDSMAPDKASRYVREVIKTNPEIFALEIVKKVAKNQLVEFVAMKRRDGIPNFTVKSFSYESDRKWQALKDKPFYYPIVFMEPMPSGSEDVLGLDVESVPFLRQAMAESLLRRMPVASHPFRLVEGNLAYIVFCPISQASRRDDSSLALAAQDELVVSMVIDAARLTEPVKFPMVDGVTVLVYHRDFSPHDPEGQLLAMLGKARSAIETTIFPAFVYQKSLATMGESFSLMVERQVGWSDLSLGLLALMTVLTLISSLMLVAYLRAHQQGRVLQIENQKQLWQHANHDLLTGLPNRRAIVEHLGIQLARVRRHSQPLSVVILDVDRFKQVNDEFGHLAGDVVLKTVAARMRECLREYDYIGRYGGEEFLVVLGDADYETAVRTAERLNQAVGDEVIAFGDKLLAVTISAGVAVAENCADVDFDKVIAAADAELYKAKTNGRNRVEACRI